VGEKMSRRVDVKLRTAQLAIVVLVLAAWQYLPSVAFVRSAVKFADPFYISSPSLIARELATLATGGDGVKPIWPNLYDTVISSFLGCVIGLAAGGIFGLLLSHYDFLAKLFKPFVAAGNALPRIALIPIILLIVGPTLRMSVVSATLVVFFLGFYNAFEGGRSVPPEVLDNARVLKASSVQIMLRIRVPYVLVWTFAAVPNAIAFSITAVVTSEILTGIGGLGDLILIASTTLDATTIFALVTILAVIGSLAYMGAERFTHKVLHWYYQETRSSVNA
jgi:NitT/TauT family transport system permease protein